MLREENARIFRELKNSMRKVDNLVGKNKTVKMLEEGKMRIFDPIGKERETEKRQKRISDERQRIAKTLKQFNDAREAEARKSASKRDVLRFTKYMEKTIPKYINFLVKDGFLLDKYLVKCPDVFPVLVHLQKNEKDTAQWFNLEDVKSKEDLKACYNFIMEWKRYFYSWRKLMWGELSGAKEQYTKIYYYMRRRGKELRAEGKNREQIYRTIAKEVIQIFKYCPGVSKIEVEREIIQNASRFWHILSDKKYDTDKYKNFRVTHKEDGKKKTITLRTWYNRVRIKGIKNLE